MAESENIRNTRPYSLAPMTPEEALRRAMQVPVPGTKTKPAPNKARPPRPTTKRDSADVERADFEGMAQPQGKKPAPAKKPRKPVKKK